MISQLTINRKCKSEHICIDDQLPIEHFTDDIIANEEEGRK